MTNEQKQIVQWFDGVKIKCVDTKRLPIQFPTQGQWWSNRPTHRSQTEQCLLRIGRLTKQAEQNRDGSNPVPPRSESSTIVCKSSKRIYAQRSSSSEMIFFLDLPARQKLEEPKRKFH